MQYTYILSLLLLMTAVSCRSQNPWSFDRVDSGNPDFNSAKISFYAKDSIHGIDLEFLKTKDHLYGYLNVHSFPIPALKSNPQLAIVQICANKKKYRFEAFRREGGQRLLLPEDAIALLLELLKNKQSIQINVSGYTAMIDPIGFAERYQKIEENPLFSNPFHLPF